MSNPAPGGFAAGLKAILDRARASVAEAQADGLAKVNAAADKLAQAGAQVTLVSETMAAQIHEQADAVLAELGQISNMPPVDGQ
jgi:trimethylamine:corrinoid methyltransferase-like protein